MVMIYRNEWMENVWKAKLNGSGKYFHIFFLVLVKFCVLYFVISTRRECFRIYDNFKSNKKHFIADGSLRQFLKIFIEGRLWVDFLKRWSAKNFLRMMITIILYKNEGLDEGIQLNVSRNFGIIYFHVCNKRSSRFYRNLLSVPTRFNPLFYYRNKELCHRTIYLNLLISK